MRIDGFRASLWAFAPVFFFSIALPIAAQTAKHNMTPDDLAKFVRVGAPVLSPDGKLIAYTVSRINAEADKRTSTNCG
jgi:hypothetical protein